MSTVIDGDRFALVGMPRPLDGAQATAAIAALVSGRRSLVLEMVLLADLMELNLRCSAEQKEEVARALWGVVPEWDIRPSAVPDLPTLPLCLAGRLSRCGVGEWAPFRAIASQDAVDTLGTLIEAGQPHEYGAWVMIRYLVRPCSPRRRTRLLQSLSQVAPVRSMQDLTSMVLGESVRQPRFAPAIHRRLEARLHETGLEVQASVVLAGSDVPTLQSRARSLASAFAAQSDAGFGGIALGGWRWHTSVDTAMAVTIDHGPDLYLTVGELANLWHMPSDQVIAPGLVRLRRPARPVPLQVPRRADLLLGTHQYRGQQTQVCLPRADLESGHAAVLGRTGMGKSTLEHNLVHQVIAEPDRPGLCVIDPHGDLVRAIAERSIPPKRQSDVVFLELGDTAFPVGLPMFVAPPDVPLETVTQTTFALIRLIFREHWSATRMEEAVYALTATLCHMPAATLMDVPRLLNDAGFRRRALRSLTDPFAREFWAEYEQLSEGSKRELRRPILHRLRAFYRSSAVRNIICQTRGVDFAECLEHNRIVLVSLAGSAIQAEADLLGELIITRLHLAALARLDRPASERQSFYLFIDESQRFGGASLPILLSEARKLHLTLLLSTQYLDGWGEKLVQSLFGNVGTLVTFACGPDDSRRISTRLKPFTSGEIEDLDRHEAVVKLQIKGASVPAFAVTTRNVPGTRDSSVLDRLRMQTRQRYGRARHEVDDEFNGPSTGPDQPDWKREDIDEE